MYKFILIVFLSVLAMGSSCRRISNDSITIALPEKFSGLDTITSSASDAAADRVRNLIFNSLVKKNEKFEYVGELADKIDVAEDGTTVTFTLRDGVKFHNGAAFTSADVKYTFDTLFEKKGYKSGAFFETEPDPADKTKTRRVAHIVSIETPDPLTVVFKVTRPALVNQLLSNLVAIPIIAQGTADTQTDAPVGTGPFKFVSLDKSQNILELAAFPEYWNGPATIGKIRVKTITDASALQSELQTGAVDIAPVPSNLPPDSLKLLEKAPNLTVQQFEGSNIQYLGLNTSSDVLNNKKIRQAIGYAIDRQKIIDELLFGQAKIAHSILPPQSWAYSPGTEYTFNQDKARELIKESGYKNEPIVFKYSAGNTAVNQYAQVIQSSLVDVGLNVRIETVESNVLREQLAQGGFQMNTGTWIGGNQDPIFLRDLFSSTKIPGPNVSCCNRSRYKNPQVDEILVAAENARDREVAKQKYIEAWALISDDMPLFPLWYPANMVVANKRIGNVKINPSGDWSFVKDLTIQ